MRAGFGCALVVAAACGGGSEGTPDGRIDAAGPPDAATPDAPPAGWSAPVTLSDPANSSFVPQIATRGATTVVAWHDFPPGGVPSRVVTVAITDGIVGALEPVPETLVGPKQPSLAATASGFVLAWEATDTGVFAIRTIDLDAAGHAIDAPVTVSAPGVSGQRPDVNALGDDVAFAWTTGAAHYFARRGPVETVAATPVGSTLMSTVITNVPRIAMTSDGVLFVLYRDGGTQASDWEALLMIRQIGGNFQGPLDISRSPGLLSDDVALQIEPDDTLDILWVDQDPVNVNSFEVDFATRTPAGVISAPGRFGTQGLWSWTPSPVPGMTAAWRTGQGAGGDLYLAEAGGAPQQILAGEQGANPGIALDPDGALHLVWATTVSPRQIRYAVRR